MAIPRPEYPRPQYRRERWLCLNGSWSFADDPSDDGEVNGLLDGPLPDCIVVPFCRESSLSGLARTRRVLAVWYQRHVTVPADWASDHVWLHIGAADYETTIWIDGHLVGSHEGGHTSFAVDCGPCAGRTIDIRIRCRDSWLDAKPCGKQVRSPLNTGCSYTRTTGIWQTVWLEPRPACHMRRPRLTPLVDQGAILLEQRLRGWRPGLHVEATISDATGPITTQHGTVGHDFTPTLLLELPADRRRLWQPGDPQLYELVIRLLNDQGDILDTVTSYTALRSVAVHGDRVLINGRSVFQRLVLDQGYYPDGLLTAPDDAALVRDIDLALAAGFNGARLHQKIFEERFLYHADRLGYLCWGEMPDWISEVNLQVADRVRRWDEKWLCEWQETLERDYSHPAIIGWCALNEQESGNPAQREIQRRLSQALFTCAKQLDRSRPVLDASGWEHLVHDSDIFDVHDYNQDPAAFRAHYQALAESGRFDATTANNPVLPHRGQPFFISEMGGTAIGASSEAAWGYGTAAPDREAFYERFAGLTGALLDNPHIFAYCWTQLTDVFQEQNGIVRFDRSAKCDLARLKTAQIRPAAIEAPTDS